MDREYWDDVAKKMSVAPGYHLDRVMADHKRSVHTALLDEWCADPGGSRILKTDLFEEALGRDQVMIGWPEDLRETAIFGTDISLEIARGSRERAALRGRTIRASVGDARNLPFRGGAFRYVYSSSTLDHFDRKEDLFRGIEEAFRVLEPGGFLVLTLDNPKTLFYPVVRRLGARGLFGFRLGETVTDGELRGRLREWDVDVMECRAIYHVHRLLYTALFRAVRLFHLNLLEGSIGRHFRRLERRQQTAGEFRTGWYTAWKLRKRGGVGGERGRSDEGRK